MDLRGLYSISIIYHVEEPGLVSLSLHTKSPVLSNTWLDCELFEEKVVAYSTL